MGDYLVAFGVNQHPDTQTGGVVFHTLRSALDPWAVSTGLSACIREGRLPGRQNAATSRAHPTL